MFKSKIQDILKRVWDEKATKQEEEHLSTKCKDCDKVGHSTKRSRQCEYYQPAATQVGTNYKRKTTEKETNESKRLKKNARQSRTDDNLEVRASVCSSCHQEGHNSARSRQCTNYKPTKAEAIQALLGSITISVTRKIKLETIVRPEYKAVFLNKVQKVSEHVRNIMIRSQLFVNYYIIINADQAIDDKVFSQNFWYAITQLVLKKKPNSKHLPGNLMEHWNSCTSRFNVFYDMVPLVNGYSHCVTAACIEMATTYTNTIVESFETRVKAYMLYTISKLFEKLDKGVLKNIIHVYCYQKVCGGTPSWPDNLDETYNNRKTAIDDICNAISNINMPKPVTFESLSKSPGAYIPMLSNILKKHEEVYYEPQEGQVLPRLFSLAPTPSFKWRFISINPNSLSAFTSILLPSSYEGKFEMLKKSSIFQG